MDKVSLPPQRKLINRWKALFRGETPDRSLHGISASAGILITAAAILMIFFIGSRWYHAIQGQKDAADLVIAYTQPRVVFHGPEKAGRYHYPLSSGTDLSTAQPRADLPSGFYNFGAISPNAVVKRDFLLINHGDAPLVIHEAHTTCGCTSASFTATVIPPGQASRITMIFNAGFHDISGQTVRRGLLMATNDPDLPELEIWVQASVR